MAAKGRASARRGQGALAGLLSTAVAVVGVAGALSASTVASASVTGTAPVAHLALRAPAMPLTAVPTSSWTQQDRPSHLDLAPAHASVALRTVPQAGGRAARVSVSACDVPWSTDGTCAGRRLPVLADVPVAALAGGSRVAMSGVVHLQAASTGPVAWVLSAS